MEKVKFTCKVCGKTTTVNVQKDQVEQFKKTVDRCYDCELIKAIIKCNACDETETVMVMRKSIGQEAVFPKHPSIRGNCPGSGRPVTLLAHPSAA